MRPTPSKFAIIGSQRGYWESNFLWVYGLDSPEAGPNPAAHVAQAQRRGQPRSQGLTTVSAIPATV